MGKALTATPKCHSFFFVSRLFFLLLFPSHVCIACVVFTLKTVPISSQHLLMSITAVSSHMGYAFGHRLPTEREGIVDQIYIGQAIPTVEGERHTSAASTRQKPNQKITPPRPSPN